MQLFVLFTYILAFSLGAHAFTYKRRVVNTSPNNKQIIRLTIENLKAPHVSGHNLALKPDGDDFKLVIDKQSPVLLASLKNGTLRAQRLMKNRLVQTALHANFRNIRQTHGGNTTLKDVYFSKNTAQGEKGYALQYVPRTAGIYFLTHTFPFPKKVRREIAGFALCPQDGGTYYQLVFVTSNGRKLEAPSNCIGVGVYTTLAPLPNQLKGSDFSHEPVEAEPFWPWTTVNG